MTAKPASDLSRRTVIGGLLAGIVAPHAFARRLPNKLARAHSALKSIETSTGGRLGVAVVDTGGHPIGAFIANDINRGRADLGLERMLEAVRKKSATAKYLMQNRDWDCMMILFGESDGVGHHFWKYCDPKSPLYQTEPAGLGDSILKVYQELDRQIAELTRLLPVDTTLLMMSDRLVEALAGVGGDFEMSGMQAPPRRSCRPRSRRGS